MNTAIHQQIRHNEKQINQFYKVLKENNRLKRRGLKSLSYIKNGIDNVYPRYQAMVFSYQNYQGEQGLYDLLKQHHHYAIEFALCFIEIRPYYYRSGYMYQKLRPKLKYSPLTLEQQARYNSIQVAYQHYRQSKNKLGYTKPQL